MHEKRIYLIRHAEPANPDGKKRYLGQSDPDLSREGLRQAEALAAYMEKFTISEIYSSDLTRALRTAGIVAARFKLAVKTDARLREINMGEWENLTFEEVLNRYPEEYEKRGLDIAYSRPSGGESFADLNARALPAFYEIAERSAGNTAIVAHSGANRVILCALMGIPLKDLFTIKVEYASVFVIIVKGVEFIVEESVTPSPV